MKRLWIGIILLATLAIGGCSADVKSKQSHTDTVQDHEIEQKHKLEVWCHYGGWEAIEAAFEAAHPGVDVTVKEFAYNEYVPAYLDALSTGEVPDVMIIDSNHMGQFNTLDVFEDLTEPPYTAVNYQKDFDKELWQAGMDFYGKKLIALPFATAPVVTYYRADIMEKYGFPSDPKELGDYMANVDNWIEMGRKLKADGIYMTQWVADPITILGKSEGYFDGSFNFLRDNDLFKTGIDISAQITQEGLVPFVDIWDETGQKYLKDGKFAMLYFGSWGAGTLKGWVPEQSGKWRVTRLPFDVYGWNNSTFMSIPEQSKEKKLAWDFIEYYTFKREPEATVGNVSSYLPLRNNPKALAEANTFLGGQKEQEIYEEVLDKTKEYMLTPLDEQAEEIIVKNVNTGIDRHYSTEIIMNNITHEIDALVAKEKPLLLPKGE